MSADLPADWRERTLGMIRGTEPQDGAWFAEDLGSMNGTRVNGELIRRKQLFGGEELVIGNTLYRFDMQFAPE